MATFSTAEYGWSDLQIFALGRVIRGVTSLKYKVSQEKEEIYAAGNEPRGFGYGNKKYEGTIELLQSEVEALELAAGPGNDITDIHDATITAAYAPKLGGKISTDVIEYVEFMEYEKGMAQNDKFAKISIPFKALKISNGV